MSRHDPRPVMVIADGRCKFIGEAKWNEVKDAQESLPEEMRMLLCLIDGAERRQNLLRRWSGQAPVTAPLAAHTAAVSSKSPTQDYLPLLPHRQVAHDTPALAALELLAPAREFAPRYRHHCTT
jgi:hypothetical protein